MENQETPSQNVAYDKDMIQYLNGSLSPCRYTVNELGRWEMEFGIHVKTYDQVTKKEGNVTKPKWIPGGEIVIGPHVRRGRGKYGRVSTLRDIILSR